MEIETAGQELVKCVLVGDTAVGKTRLICARTGNARMSLRQLLTTHVPTVWAIDQYRMCKEVLERSMAVVDGVQTRLIIWDTFGDHEKDRRFAYGRSDIILLCFSIGSLSSLLHCKSMWFPEIRRFCPDTPVFLVGCKNDLRFLCRDPTYLAFCRDRSPFLRPARESDIVMPEQARALAKEIGVPYYETSVFTYHGVTQVFENATRAALIARRNQRFWMTNLKHVQQPLIQAPYCPPKIELNSIEVFPGNFWCDIKNMLLAYCFPDLIFVTGGSEIMAHRFIVAAGAPNLSPYLQPDDHLLYRRNSETSTTSGSTTTDETECLIKRGEPSEPMGIINTVYSSCSELEWKWSKQIKCSAIETVRTRDSTHNLGNVQVVIQLTDKVSYETVRSLLHFLYIGEFPQNNVAPSNELRETAELFRIPELVEYIDSWIRHDTKSMTDLKKSYRQYLKTALWSKCTQGYHSDVVFHLDDGRITAHRSLLMARSDVMRAMFSGDFRERRSHFITLPGVKKETFLCFLEFLYTDSLSPPVPVDVAMPLIEFANRLCLPRLVNILENILISDIAEKQSRGMDVTDEYIKILEPAQLHNAEQLAQWCLIQLATNYDTMCRKHNTLFKELSCENRQWVSVNRWPPVWYVKDYDYYQKALMERYKTDHPEKKCRKRNNSGCLCFPGKSRRDGCEDRIAGMVHNSYSTV